MQKRDVYCRLKGKGRVEEGLCDALLRPSSLQQCLFPECHGYSWAASEWQEVSFLLSHFQIFLNVSSVKMFVIGMLLVIPLFCRASSSSIFEILTP